MNKFELEGTVDSVEVCVSKKENEYYRILLDADDELVPLTVFERVNRGDLIRVTGKLSSWKSDKGHYLAVDNVKVKTMMHPPAAATQSSSF